MRLLLQEVVASLQMCSGHRVSQRSTNGCSMPRPVWQALTTRSMPTALIQTRWPSLMPSLLTSLHQHASDVPACRDLRKLCLSTHAAPICAVLHVQGMLQWHFPTAKTRRKQSVQLKPVKPAATVVTTMLDALLAGEDRLQASYCPVMHTTKASQAAALAADNNFNYQSQSPQA